MKGEISKMEKDKQQSFLTDALKKEMHERLIEDFQQMLVDRFKSLRGIDSNKSRQLEIELQNQLTLYKTALVYSLELYNALPDIDPFKVLEQYLEWRKKNIENTKEWDDIQHDLDKLFNTNIQERNKVVLSVIEGSFKLLDKLLEVRIYSKKEHIDYKPINPLNGEK
jgi:hypothetical protein